VTSFHDETPHFKIEQVPVIVCGTRDREPTASIPVNGQVHSGQQDQDERRAEAEAKSEENSVRELNSVMECSTQSGWNGIDGSS